MLTGVCLIGDKSMPSLVVVEGGHTAIKRYKRLMLVRVQWNKPPTPREKKESEDGEGHDQGEVQKESAQAQEINDPAFYADNRCSLVWEGVVKRRTFDKWKVIDFRSENEARRILADKAVV
jgi:U4/U6 small nuclear ribonucleoprotein PRP3